MDSSSWYLKPDHDVIITLSEVREGLPFQLISRPACLAYLHDASGHITGREMRALRTELSEYELRAYL